MTDFQASHLCKFSQPLLGTSGAEQRNALRSEPLLGDRHELLERIIAGLAKELDRSRRLTEANTAGQVVNDAAPTRSRAATGEGAKVFVVALDCRSSPLPSEPPPNLDSFAGRTLLWRAFALAKVSPLNSEAFCLRVQLTGYKSPFSRRPQDGPGDPQGRPSVRIGKQHAKETAGTPKNVNRCTGLTARGAAGEPMTRRAQGASSTTRMLS